jgi:hypothetical protein
MPFDLSFAFYFSTHMALFVPYSSFSMSYYHESITNQRL